MVPRHRITALQPLGVESGDPDERIKSRAELKRRFFLYLKLTYKLANSHPSWHVAIEQGKDLDQ